MKSGVACLILAGLLLGSCGGSKSSSSPAPNPGTEPNPDPVPNSCVEKQRTILESSGWNLAQGLDAVIDALLRNQATQTPLPVCTSL